MNLQETDTIFTRGVYGKGSPETNRNNVYIAAGGTGIAAALSLAEKLSLDKKKVHTFYGMSSRGQTILEEDFLKFGSFTAVEDNGIPCRVVDTLKDELTAANGEAALYAVGPVPFMEKAAETFIECGGLEKDVFLSIETSVRCGIGLCGECECGGHLTCREGTFFSLAWLNSKNINFKELFPITNREKSQLPGQSASLIANPGRKQNLKRQKQPERLPGNDQISIKFISGENYA